jgi:putative Holliday junction resolvase
LTDRNYAIDLGVDVTRNLGLDIGDKRIGVALSDPQGILASPLTIVNRSDDQSAIEAIVTVVHQHEVGQVIVGLPLSMDGSLGWQAKKVKDFTEELRGHLEVPLEFRDERLSTVSAIRLTQGMKKAKKTRHDAMAAALILQSYLDEFRS